MSTTPGTRADLGRLVVGWMVRGPREPLFDHHWLGPLQHPPQGGALWRLRYRPPARPLPRGAWVCGPLPAELAMSHTQTVPQAWELARRQAPAPGQMLGLALTGTPRSAGLTGLALGFSAYLGLRRRAGPFVVSADPLTDAASTAVPHFVAVPGEPAGTVRDIVLWEVVPLAHLGILFGCNADAVHPWQARADQLCALRARLRATAIPPRLRRLQAALGCTRYLSFKFVVEHPDLVREALAESAPPAPQECHE